jgi:hypothetical protein
VKTITTESLPLSSTTLLLTIALLAKVEFHGKYNFEIVDVTWCFRHQ